VRELLLNISKHAGSAEAWVTLKWSTDQLRITVRDQGKGFDPGILASVNADEATGISSKFGLFSIRERMQALGGEFDIHSSVGGGTMATLILPLQGVVAPVVRDEKPAFTMSTRPSTPSTAVNLQDLPLSLSSKVRVLLVDDHAMVRQGLRSLLEAYEDVDIVGEASDGEEALSTMEEMRPGFVVRKINMPKKNGIEATTEIKARWPETVVIGLSVNPGGANSRAMQKAGATLLLTKEAAVVELYHVIREALAVNEGAKRTVEC